MQRSNDSEEKSRLLNLNSEQIVIENGTKPKKTKRIQNSQKRGKKTNIDH